MSGPKYPVVIDKVQCPNGTVFQARTSIAKLNLGPAKLEGQLKLIESDYEIAIGAARAALEKSKKNAVKSKTADPRMYWLVGEYLIGFLNRLSGLGFYLGKQNGTLGRDLGLSDTSVEKIISFRKRVSDPASIDPSFGWNRYRENRARSRPQGL